MRVKLVVGAIVLFLAAASWLVADAARVRVPAPPAVKARPAPRGVVWRVPVPTNQKVVALTFDDGPDPVYTPAILELARAKGAKFTFFVVGRQGSLYPDIVKRMAAEGHAVENHTWDHHEMTRLSERQDVSEIELCDDEITSITGSRPSFMRPPRGEWDDDVYRAAAALGYRVIMWSIELEHHPRRSPQQMAQRAINLARPGMIILAHDGAVDRHFDRTKTMQALPILVDGLLKKGYRFVTVPELMGMATDTRQTAEAAPPAAR
jgi:peptidoglycan/xylan/chitin deacetylase (PgdA/CDA1 family)